MEAASWALVGITIVLCGLTGWYATETRRIVKRMDEEREAVTRPHLTIQVIPWQPGLLKLRIQNLGNGPAFRIKGEIKSIASDSNAESPKFDWSYVVLSPGKYEEFGFPSRSERSRFRLQEIRETVARTEAHFEYFSGTGRRYTLDELVDIKELTADWVDSRMMATDDHPERLLPRIAKALEDIAKGLKSP